MEEQQQEEEHAVGATRRLWREVEPQEEAASAAATTWPTRRHGHSAVVWPKNGAPALCVYGGLGDGDSGDVPRDDLFLFDFLKGEWRRAANNKAAGAAKPAGRHSHTAVVWRDSMFVFGGATTADASGVPSGQLLEFNFRKGAWSEVKTKGEQPKPRWGHSAVLVLASSHHHHLSHPDHRAAARQDAPRSSSSSERKKGVDDGDATMWVFGGLTTTGADNDLFCFHFRTHTSPASIARTRKPRALIKVGVGSKTWERIVVDVEGGGGCVVPSARHLHSAVVSADGQRMVVVGGHSGRDSADMADAFSFHFGNREWREVAVPASFRGRRGHRAAAVVEVARGNGGGGGEVMVVHGGRDKDGPLDDLHLFRFGDESWSEVKASSEGWWPSGRYLHSLTAWAGRLWMFGGLGMDDYDDVHADDKGQGASKPRNLADFHQFCSLEGAGFYDVGQQRDDRISVAQGKHRTVDFIAVLPSEISLHILSFVPSAEVGATLPLVSKTWQTFVEDDALWRDAFHTLVHSLERTPVPLGSLNTDQEKEVKSFKAQVQQYVERLEAGMKIVGNQVLQKMVVMGPGGVGKSALTIMLIQKHFIIEYDPTIEDSYRKQVMINGHVVLLDILDTAGEDWECVPMRDQHVRSGSAFLLVYSINRRDSFEELVTRHWASIMKVKEGGDIPFSAILVGNKCDVDTHGDVMHWDGKLHGREVTFEEGAALARQMSAESGRAVPFIETSAKYNVNVSSAFAGLALMEMRRLDLMRVARAKRTKPSKCVLS